MSILSEVKDMVDELHRRQLTTEYVGIFPVFVKAICDCIESATSSLLIACDYPTYAAFSATDIYRRYRALLHEKARGGVAIDIVVLDDELKLDHLRRQFGTSGKNGSAWQNEVRSERFQSCLSSYSELCDELYDDLDMPDAGLLPDNPDQFFEWIIRFQDRERDNVFMPNQASVSFSQTKSLMPIFLWIADFDRRAVFSIPRFGANFEEHGFQTRSDQIITALRSFHTALKD